MLTQYKRLLQYKRVLSTPENLFSPLEKCVGHSLKLLDIV